MNIFNETTSITGKTNIGELNKKTKSIISIIKDLKSKLGDNAYILDKYLYDLFDAISISFFHNPFEMGADFADELICLCNSIIEGDDQNKNHPLYSKVKKYIESNPKKYLENSTKLNLYYLDLMDDFFESMILEFLKEQDNKISNKIDTVYFNDIYDKIVSLLKTDVQMVKLNNLIKQRFLVTTSIDCFIQGINSVYIYSLLERDIQTQNPMLNLWINDV